MRRSTALPLFALLLGGCPFEENSLSTTPAVTAGDAQPDESGYRVLARTIDPRWPQIDAMALSDNYLVFSMNWHGVYKMPKFGGPIETIEADENAVFERVAVNRSEIVWEKATFDSHDYPFVQIKKQAVDGGPTMILSASRTNTDWRINAESIVFATADGPTVTLSKQPLASGSSAVRFVFVDDKVELNPLSWALDETDAYAMRCPETTCALVKYPLAGGDSIVLAEFDLESPYSVLRSTGYAGWISLDGDQIYVRTGKHIRAFPKQGGAPFVVFTAADEESIDLANPITAISDTSIFFDLVRRDGLIIASVPKTGGPAVDIGFDSRRWNFPWQMLSSDDYLFFRSLDFRQSSAGGVPVAESPGVILLAPAAPPAMP